MVAEPQSLPELNVSGRFDRGRFIPLAPDKTQRYYTLKHACFLNIDATNGGCHYVSVRMCERENRTQDPLLLQFLFNRYQTIVFVHSLPSTQPTQFEKGHA